MLNDHIIVKQHSYSYVATLLYANILFMAVLSIGKHQQITYSITADMDLNGTTILLCDCLSENQPIVHTSDYTNLMVHKILLEFYTKLKFLAMIK